MTTSPPFIYFGASNSGYTANSHSKISGSLIGKDVEGSDLRYALSRHFPGGTEESHRKTLNRIFGARPEINFERLSNTIQNYCISQPVRSVVVSYIMTISVVILCGLNFLQHDSAASLHILHRPCSRSHFIPQHICSMLVWRYRYSHLDCTCPDWRVCCQDT